MEIINRLHKEISQNTRLTLANYLRVERNEFYFSAGCNIALGIIPGLYMHFINDDDRWLFYMNSEKDGFYIVEKWGKKATCIINASLASLFLKRTLCSVGSKFPIKMTPNKMKEAPIYEIMINKTFK